MNDDIPEPPNTVRRRAGLPPYPQPHADTFSGRLAALHEQILRNLIKGVEEIKDHALRVARTGQSDFVLSTDDEITEEQPETCTATLSGAPIAGSLHRCSASAGHYDEDRQPTNRGGERDTGGWHYTTPSETGDQVVWADRADGATPHDARCSGCGHTEGEGCGCPAQPSTLLEVREDETPDALRELTAAVRELVTVMREDLDGRTEDAEATSPVDWLAQGARDLSIPEQRPAPDEDTPLAACRDMETRTCPASYAGPCGDRPCARFESDDPTPWLDNDAELRAKQLETLLRVANETSNRSEAERAHAVQRAEAADRLRAKAERDRDQHAAVLAEVLATFVHKVGGYRIPRRSGEVDVVTLDKWRSMVAPTMERPWWEAVAEAKAERDQAQATVARVRHLRDRWLLMTLEPGQVRRLLDEVTRALDSTAQRPQEADQLRAYIDTALREGYWKEWNKHTDRLVRDLAEWNPIGIVDSTIGGLDDGMDDPSASAFAWPYEHGKAALTVQLVTPFTSMRGTFDEAFDVVYRARLDRRLARLARVLGQWEEIVRRDFHAVQQVLEDAGVLDGYGRITIPQPVRPPVIWEAS